MCFFWVQLFILLLKSVNVFLEEAQKDRITDTAPNQTLERMSRVHSDTVKNSVSAEESINRNMMNRIQFTCTPFCP